jgi:hypothetical protein
MNRAERSRGLAIAIGCAASLLATNPGCRSDADQIAAATERTGDLVRVPPSAVGGGLDPATGLPVGYPPAMPLVPGGEALSGGVDPGVIRTATLVYDGMTVETYVEALRAALEAHDQRIVTSFDTATGSKQMRVDLRSGYANLIVADDHGRVRVDVTAMDRAPRTP